MPELLRIALVLSASTGGIGRHVRTLGEALVQRGHSVTVCAPAETEPVFHWSDAGVEYQAVPIGGRASVPGGAGWRALRRLMEGADVVHAHGTRAGAAAALVRCRPLVVTWHNAPTGGRLQHAGQAALERLSARRADLIIGASEDLAERARSAGATHARFIPVVAPPLAPADRPRSEVRDELGVGDRPLVLVVARLARQKRLDVLVEATAGWADRPDAPLVVVAGDGDGEIRRSIEMAARRLRAPVVLLGHRTDVADLLAAADLAVLSSDWEARPLVIQEALRAGVPTVATAVGGIPGLVNGAAELVPPADPARLRLALDQLLADPARRSTLGAAGQTQAGTWPTVDDMTDTLVKTYVEVRSRVRR